jgi:hypothetical protein
MSKDYQKNAPSSGNARPVPREPEGIFVAATDTAPESRLSEFAPPPPMGVEAARYPGDDNARTMQTLQMADCPNGGRHDLNVRGKTAKGALMVSCTKCGRLTKD